MSSEPAPATPAAGPWPPLDTRARRLLGVLVEKAKTTPDSYPLSVNALVTGANQKSNRDPILHLAEEDVDEVLSRLQADGLVMKITGGRVVRWRHVLYDAWNVNKVELAVLAELLLRGPQTEGELRVRASRMEPIGDLDSLRAVLRPLAERNLVLYLTPEGRGAVVTHGFHAPEELARLRTHALSQPAPAPRADERPAPAEDHLAQVRDEVASLRQAFEELRATLAAVQAELKDLKQSLGA